MYKNKIFIAAILLVGMALSGYQCSSTELTSAKLYIQQKNYDKALEVLQKEVEKNPQSDEGYYWIGVVYSEKEEYQKMNEAFNQSLSISNKFAEQIDAMKIQAWAALFNRGVKYYQQGTSTDNEDSSKVYFNQSISAFEKAVEIEPDSADAYKNLAFVYMSAREYDKAIQPLEKLIEKENSVDGYKFLGEILYGKGVEEQNQYEVTGEVQDSVAALEYFNRTISILEEARQKYPDDSDILLTLSNAYIGANKIDVAIDAFKAGVEQEPDNKFYRYNYGVLLLGANDFEAAEEQFKRALEIDPEYENAIYNLAVTYVRWGANLSKIAEEKGESSDEAKEKYRLALPYLEQVVETKQDDSAVWELLGRVYTILDLQEDAKNAFDRADQLRQ